MIVTTFSFTHTALFTLLEESVLVIRQHTHLFVYFPQEEKRINRIKYFFTFKTIFLVVIELIISGPIATNNATLRVSRRKKNNDLFHSFFVSRKERKESWIQSFERDIYFSHHLLCPRLHRHLLL